MLMLLFLCVPLSAPASERVVASLLQGYEWSLDGKAMRALGPDTWQALMTIARDPAQGGVIRARALIALSLFDNDSVLHFFASELQAETSLVVRRNLVDAMCETFAGTRPAAVIATVAPLLDSGDAPERIRAARCLVRLDATTAGTALKRYREASRAAWEYEAAGFKESGNE